jgi:hypothetical protein
MYMKLLRGVSSLSALGPTNPMKPTKLLRPT